MREVQALAPLRRGSRASVGATNRLLSSWFSINRKLRSGASPQTVLETAAWVPTLASMLPIKQAAITIFVIFMPSTSHHGVSGQAATDHITYPGGAALLGQIKLCLTEFVAMLEAQYRIGLVHIQ